MGAGGELLEGASSNLFVVTGGVLRTPPVAVGILAGITRAVVMEVAAAEGIAVREEVLFPRDAYDADEVLITSSIREVVPVVRVDDVAVGDGAPGPVAARLLEAYRRRARGGEQRGKGSPSPVRSAAIRRPSA